MFSINGGWNTLFTGTRIRSLRSTPGVVDAAQKFAKFPLKTLFEPALFFAENGFKMSAWLNWGTPLNNNITLLRTAQGNVSTLTF